MIDLILFSKIEEIKYIYGSLYNTSGCYMCQAIEGLSKFLYVQTDQILCKQFFFIQADEIYGRKWLTILSDLDGTLSVVSEDQNCLQEVVRF